jgi:uncharacterized membrane protein YeaQ/YmgE (transglycosylase-associated protein family)
MSLVVLIALGLAAGWLASRFVGVSRYGVVGDVTAGVAGAWTGGFLAARVLHGGLGGFDAPTLGVGLLGAVLLITAVRVLTGSVRAPLWPH